MHKLNSAELQNIRLISSVCYRAVLNFLKIEIFEKMSLDDQLMQKENELLEIKSRIGYIDGNVDQARFINSATV